MKAKHLLGLSGLILGSVAGLGGAPPPVPGPGAVCGAVQEFLARQDGGGDFAALLVDGAGGVELGIDREGRMVEPAAGAPTPVFLDVGADGQPLAAARAAEFGKELAGSVAADAKAGRGLRTTVQSVRADCNSPTCSWAVVLFERVYSDAAGERRVPMRATALLQYQAGAAPTFRIFQWHASRAVADPRAAAQSAK